MTWESIPEWCKWLTAAAVMAWAGWQALNAATDDAPRLFLEEIDAFLNPGPAICSACQVVIEGRHPHGECGCNKDGVYIEAEKRFLCTPCEDKRLEELWAVEDAAYMMNTPPGMRMPNLFRDPRIMRHILMAWPLLALLWSGCAAEQAPPVVAAPSIVRAPVEPNPCADIEATIKKLAGECALEIDNGCGEECPVCDALNKLREKRKGMIGCVVTS